MFNKLEELIINAKSIYYNFPVAAILECNDGTIFTGVNVETSSPSAGICAERNALYQALAKGYNKDDFKKLSILNKTEKEITPCFICRQALIDFCNDNLEIESYNCYGDKKIFILKDLCPNIFNGGDLS